MLQLFLSRSEDVHVIGCFYYNGNDIHLLIRTFSKMMDWLRIIYCISYISLLDMNLIFYQISP